MEPNTNTTTDQKTILVAEDEVDLRDALVTALTSEGFRVLPAVDGEEALSLALAEHPDLIMLDLHMPKLDGHGVLKGLRQDEWGKTVYVIVLTAFSDVENMSNTVMEGGINMEYLVKTDWRLEGVISKIKEKLGVQP